jgi:hypothetical protein
MREQKRLVKWELTADAEIRGKNLPHCHFARHKPNTTWSRATAAPNRQVPAWAMVLPETIVRFNHYCYSTQYFSNKGMIRHSRSRDWPSNITLPHPQVSLHHRISNDCCYSLLYVFMECKTCSSWFLKAPLQSPRPYIEKVEVPVEFRGIHTNACWTLSAVCQVRSCLPQTDNRSLQMLISFIKWRSLKCSPWFVSLNL